MKKIYKKEIDDFLDKELNVPFVKKHENGLIQVFNGTYSIFMDDETLKLFNDLLKKEGKKYVTANRK